MDASRFPFSAPVMLIALSSILLSSCGQTPAPPSPFAGTYRGSVTWAIGTGNIPLSFDKAEIDTTGNFVCDATNVAYVGQKPIAQLSRIRGTLAADGSAILTVDRADGQKPAVYSGKLALSGKKLTGAVAQDATNTPQTIRLLFDLTQQ